MKTCVLALNSNLIDCEDQNKIINFIKTKTYEIGENISLISYFDNSLEKLRNIINDNYDIIYCIGSNSSVYNSNIKENLARLFNDKLEKFEQTYTSLNKYCSCNNIVFSMQEEMEIKLPTKSIPLVMEDCYFNGFMYKFNNTYIIFLPALFDFVDYNFSMYIKPLLNDLTKSDTETQVLKCFGILEKDIRNLISEYFSISEITIKIISDGLDNTILIKYPNSISNALIQDITSGICIKLNKFIYATEDISIYQMAVDLLKLQNKKVAIAETLTLGNITKELAIIDNSIIGESFIFTSFENIKKTININSKIIEHEGEYSVNTIYELSNKTLERTLSDVVVFVLGDFNNKELNYMAIGDINGIHVYKNKTLNNTKLIENLSKTAIFYLIKNLKQNDLQFR